MLERSARYNFTGAAHRLTGAKWVTDARNETKSIAQDLGVDLQGKTIHLVRLADRSNTISEDDWRLIHAFWRELVTELNGRLVEHQDMTECLDALKAVHG